MGGPLPGLICFRQVAFYQLVVCGGDGTIGWMLSRLDSVGQDAACHSPPIALLPLGTGNGLIRVLNWGVGCTSAEAPLFNLKNIAAAWGSVSTGGRWRVDQMSRWKTRWKQLCILRRTRWIPRGTIPSWLSWTIASALESMPPPPSTSTMRAPRTPPSLTAGCTTSRCTSNYACARWWREPWCWIFSLGVGVPTPGAWTGTRASLDPRTTVAS